MLRRCATASCIRSLTSWRSRAFYSTCRVLQEEAKRKKKVVRLPREEMEDEQISRAEKDDKSLADDLSSDNLVSKPVRGKSSAATERPTPKAAQLPPRIIPASTKHKDITSFLQHAADISLDPASSVFRGTVYEYRVAQTLTSYNFDLTRTGQSNDRGIDLIGHWRIPGHLKKRPRDMRIIMQCKAIKPSPSMIRELQGAYAGAPAGWNDDNVIAFLVANGEYTKGVLEALQRSESPMGVMHVTYEGSLRQIVWNEAAAKLGLEGLGVTLRYSGAVGGRSADGEVEKSLVLTWIGEAWRPKAKKKPL